MGVLKSYNFENLSWEPVLIGEPGPPGPGISDSFLGPWESDYEYSNNDLVIFGSTLWVSLTDNNEGNEPIFPPASEEDEVFWLPFSTSGGNSVGAVQFAYRETEYDAEGVTSVLGDLGAAHYYTFSSNDIGKAVIVQRTEPFVPILDENEDIIDFEGARTIYMVVPYGLGQIGDRIEVAYVPRPIDNLSNPGLEFLDFIFETQINALPVPFFTQYDEEEVAIGGTIVLGDTIPILLGDSIGHGKWSSTSVGRLTKVLTITTDVGEIFPALIPVDVWVAELHTDNLPEFNLPSFG